MSTHPPLTTGFLRLLAVASGLTVANIYYNQSLLAVMARDLHASPALAGNIAVATQLGYASGLLLGVPLGDILDRKNLIVASASAATLALVVVALAPNLLFAVGTSYLLGLICITPQFIIPYAATLSPAEKRGQVVGFVMAGVLVGILFSRSAAGFIGQALGWRAVFGLGAALTLGTAICLSALPRLPRREHRISYGQLLRSLLPLLGQESILRRHALIGALGFGAFNAFWTTVVFYLADRPEHYGGNMVGFFGLIAVGGAMAAPIAGRLSDRFSARIVNGISLLTMLGAFLLMLLADRSLLWLMAGIFFMDAGAQANQISNQTRIYTLAPELRSRITSVYMVVYFVGGGLGSALSARIWTAWHWTGVCLLGAVMSALALVVLFAGPSAAPARANATAARGPSPRD